MDSGQLIFDYTAWTPWVVNDAIDRAMTEAREAGDSASDAYSRAEVRQLQTNPHFKDKFKKTYSESGVNLISVTLQNLAEGLTSEEEFWQDLSRWGARFSELDWLHKITSPEDAMDIPNGDMGVILNTQNLGATISGSFTSVDDLYNAGIRIMQLTYNTQNILGTGCTDRSNGGLSNKGIETVEELNELGAIVDLSHCGRQTTLDAVDASEVPVACTHTSCTSVAEHDRAKSDEELKAIAEGDGYIGIYTVAPFTSPGKEPELQDFFNHLDHAISIAGTDRVGIGTDFGHTDVGCPDQIVSEILEILEEVGFREEHGTGKFATGFGEFQRYSDWPVIVRGIKERYTTEEVEGILGRNFLEFWNKVTTKME